MNTGIQVFPSEHNTLTRWPVLFILPVSCFNIVADWCIYIAVFFLDPDAHVEPHKKQLHVTLAYQFQASSLPVLEKLAKNVDVSSGCDWLAVLFSRDIRFANHEVHSLPLNEYLLITSACPLFMLKLRHLKSLQS